MLDLFVSLRLSRCSTPSQNYTSTAAHNFLLIVDSGGRECLSLFDRLIVRLFPLFCADAKLDPCQNSPTKQFFKPNIGITHQLRGYCYALKFILITARLGASQCRTRARFCLIEVLDSRYPNHATNFGLYMPAKLLSFSQGEAW